MSGSIGRINRRSGAGNKAVACQLAKPPTPPLSLEGKLQSLSCALPLPTIDKAVPATFEIRHDVRKAALCLRAFLDLDMITEADLAEPWGSERELMERAFNRFMGTEGSGLCLYEPVIALADSVDGDYCDHSNSEKTDDEVFFCFYSKSRRYLNIGKTALQIEEICPGLGETLLYHIGRGVYSTLSCATPETCLDIAKFTYWQGEEDEREVIAELLAEGENPEDMEIYRRSDYLASIPEWAANPTDKLSLARLKKIARTGEGLVRDAAKAALDLANLQVDSYRSPYFEEFIGDNVDPALFVRWSDNDDTERVYDDYYQYATQSECTDIHGYLAAITDKEEIGKMLDNIRQFFRILKALDRAFLLIGELDEEG